ncbi:ABC transporter ATP-binding protein [Staphylococcus lutrae]|uniref:Peptide ABC transporter ATP-binding protein n=1 Tax=Staphylococcus lutrae TaxID=155085 RepID=A0AAC9RTS5_9STAP|nr:ATP-binding cassette domain-containing protein [Staphylococcus lutrae]ARJ50645.1 peptide ABC transporter ATP-binding protein [Staphylococcus lutrae]PNZ39135.1 peptide ABC transporter ATP-binding protein [Staphylococcus lutrae]
MIKLEHVTVQYKETLALNDVSLTIGAHEVVGIVGESGSGKSTLAHVMLGERTGQSGTVTTTFQSALPILQHASHAFNPKMTLASALNEALSHHQAHQQQIVDYRDDLMATMGLSHALLQRYPSALSGGQLQRFNVIRTLMLQPELLICDEITAHLDVIAADRLAEQLKRHAERTQCAMVVISHDITFLQKWVSRMVVLHQGQIVDEFPIEALFDSARVPYTKSLLSLYESNET